MGFNWFEWPKEELDSTNSLRSAVLFAFNGFDYNNNKQIIIDAKYRVIPDMLINKWRFSNREMNMITLRRVKTDCSTFVERKTEIQTQQTRLVYLEPLLRYSPAK